ncbi:MAG: tryptophan synthase subunit alpha [Candidatus Micrarchaeota archaeon]
MSRISDALKKGNSYLPYVCAGDPDEDFTLQQMKVLSKHASLFELGIPFSDTLADGQVIQAASDRALKNGITPKKCISIIAKAREMRISQPIIAMTYYNIIFKYGLEDFCRDLKDAGGDGVLAADLPFEESAELREACKAHNLDLIYMISPTTSEERMKNILSEATGFVYLVAVIGITGAREEMQQYSLELIRRVKAHSSIPVAIGFGISKPEHAKAAFEAGADGVIEGSQLIRIYGEFFKGGITPEKRAAALEALERHAKEMTLLK